MRIAIKKTDNIRKIVHAIDIEIVDDSSLTCILSRHNKAFELFLTSTDSDRKNATDRLEFAIETKFSYHHILA